MIYPLLLIGLCLLITVVGAWTDIRAGRVSNKYLLATAAIGAIIYASAIAMHQTTWTSLASWSINLLLSIILSIVFYLYDVWAPGDAKMFILVAALYPFAYYAAPPANLFPALSIIVFAYAVGYIYLVIVALSRPKKGQRKLELPTLDRSFIVGFLINAGVIIGSQIAIETLFPHFCEANQVLVLLSTVGLCYILQRKYPKALSALGVLNLLATLILAVITLDYKALLLSLPLSIIMALLTQLLVRMADTNSYREIKGEELRPGMILSYGSIMAMQKCIDPNIPRQTTENRRSRLSTSQAEAVRNWCRITNRPVMIVEMLPFAPFIGIGLLVELLRHFLIY